MVRFGVANVVACSFFICMCQASHSDDPREAAKYSRFGREVVPRRLLPLTR